MFGVLNRNFSNKPHSVPSFEKCKSLIIGSDYSGDSKEDPYRVYSFLLVGEAAWREWEERRLLLRKKLMPDNRRMSYKKLGDRYRREFLKPILDTANELDGLLFSLVVNKAVPSLFGPQGTYAQANPDFVQFQTWNRDTIEKAFTLLHLVGFLLAGLGKEGQNIMWFTDQDRVAANPAMLSLFTKAFSWISAIYLDFDLGHFRCGTTACDDGSRSIEDFVAIPDLISGALSEQFRSSALLGARFENVLWLTGVEMKEKAQTILFRYATNNKRLKKHVVVVDPTADKRDHLISWFNFANDSPPTA